MSPPASPLVRRGKPVPLCSKELSRKAGDQETFNGEGDVIEEDLEIIDLEARTPAPRSPVITQSPLRMKQRIGEVSSRSIDEAEADLVSLVREGAALESRLQTESQPNLAEAARVLEAKTSRVDFLQSCIDESCDAHPQQLPSLAEITRSQLSEARQLARSPPEHVRRTLTAVWLVLNSDRFRGKTSIQLNEERTWHQCQKMLADTGFVSRLQSFDAASLDEVPHLTVHIARIYLGCQDSDISPCEEKSASSCEDSQHFASQGLTRCATAPCLTSQHRQQGGLHHSDSVGSLRNTSLRQKHNGLRSDPWADMRAGAFLENTRTMRLSASRPSTCSRPSSKFVVLAPLDLEDVQHASGPCGAIFRWLRALVLARVKPANLQLQLAAARKELADAEQAHNLAEQCVIEVQAELQANHSRQLRQDKVIANLKKHMANHSVRKSPNRTDFVRTPNKRGQWFKPALDITGQFTLTFTNLQNSKWWRSREYLSSPKGSKSFGLW